MCLRRKSELITAGCDITVYKVLYCRDNDMVTPYMLVPVKDGDTVTSSLKPHEGIDRYFIGGEGVHAYISPEVAISNCNLIQSIRVDRIISILGSQGGGFIVKEAVIPCGEEYYLGEKGEIASGSMIIGSKVVYDARRGQDNVLM